MRLVYLREYSAILCAIIQDLTCVYQFILNNDKGPYVVRWRKAITKDRLIATTCFLLAYKVLMPRISVDHCRVCPCNTIISLATNRHIPLLTR